MHGLYLQTLYRSCAMGRQWSGIYDFQLMKVFNTTEAAIFPTQAILLYDFPFSQIKRACADESNNAVKATLPS